MIVKEMVELVYVYLVNVDAPWDGKACPVDLSYKVCDDVMVRLFVF